MEYENYYRVELYNNFSLVTEIFDYEVLEFGERDNDFVDARFTINVNKIDDLLRQNLVKGCSIKIFRKEKLVWSGRCLKDPEFSLNNEGIKTKSFIFEHIGKYFLRSVFINKNYNLVGGVDEALIAQDAVLYCQTAASYLPAVVEFGLNYGVTIGTIQSTGNLRNVDYSAKPVSLLEGLKQLVNFEDPLNRKRGYTISPNLIDNTENRFNFYNNRSTDRDVTLYGVSQIEYSGSIQQNIESLKVESGEEVFNVIVASGDGIPSVTLVSSDANNFLKWGARKKYVSFKNVKEPANLLSLASKELTKSQKPEPKYSLEIVACDEVIGTFGVGDLVRVEYLDEEDSTQSVNTLLRVYEVMISLDQEGRENCKLTLAANDPVKLGGSRLKFIQEIKDQNERIRLLES